MKTIILIVLSFLISLAYGDTWTSATPAGGVTPSAGLPNGTYGRFQYIKEYDVFVGVNSVDESVWLFKPQN